MKHLILSVSSESYSISRLIEEIKKRKDEYEVINPADLYAYISSATSGFDRIYKRGTEKSERILSKNFDSVIPRIAGGNFDHGCMIVKHLSNNMGIFTTGSERGLKICSNKFLTSQILSTAKIRNPKQVLSHQPTDYKELIDLVDGLPCVAKLQRGSLGVGVMILNDPLAASTSLKSFESVGVDVILQQYIDSGEPKSDIRVFVVGAESKNPQLFAYKRYALDSDFRSNYSISGKGEKVKITDEERQMALNGALAVGLGVCGVDIIRDSKDNNKPYLIEINGSPGLEGIETVTKENVAGAIIDYVKENYKSKTVNSMNSLNEMKSEVENLKKEIDSIVAKRKGTVKTGDDELQTAINRIKEAPIIKFNWSGPEDEAKKCLTELSVQDRMNRLMEAKKKAEKLMDIRVD